MSKRRVAAGITALMIPAGVLAAAPSANAECQGGCDDGAISVRVSDSTPASGQQFVARGSLVIGGRPAPAHTVKVQTLLGGQWKPIAGARVTTDADGRYRVRLILSTKGDRVLRVVGLGRGADEKTERKRFTVRVH
jgi:hypothetical protein